MSAAPMHSTQLNEVPRSRTHKTTADKGSKEARIEVNAGGMNSVLLK